MIVEIKIGKSNYKIDCKESDQSKILSCADKLNNRVNKLTFNLGNIDEKTLLVITCLMMEEELKNLKTKISKNSPTTNSSQINSHLNTENKKYSEDEVLEAISESTDNINDYLTKIINKIQEY